MNDSISYDISAEFQKTQMPKKTPKPKYNRRYLGVTVTAENYKEILEKEGRAGINHHNKHLKAYLQGKKMFKDGFQKDTEGKLLRDFSGNPIPAMYEVKQELTLLTDK